MSKDIYVVFRCGTLMFGQNDGMHFEAVYTSRRKAKAHVDYFNKQMADGQSLYPEGSEWVYQEHYIRTVDFSL